MRLHASEMRALCRSRRRSRRTARRLKWCRSEKVSSTTQRACPVPCCWAGLRGRSPAGSGSPSPGALYLPRRTGPDQLLVDHRQRQQLLARRTHLDLRVHGGPYTDSPITIDALVVDPDQPPPGSADAPSQVNRWRFRSRSTSDRMSMPPMRQFSRRRSMTAAVATSSRRPVHATGRQG